MDELVLMVGGCCATKNVQFDHCWEGYSHYKCQSCGEVFREAEDSGCGG